MTSATTLRKELTDAGLRWDLPFTLIVQRLKTPLEAEKRYYDAVEVHGQWFPLGWNPDSADLLANVIITQNHPLLDVECDLPRFWCKTPTHIYFPGTYDGSTWVAKVALYPNMYLDGNEPMPYVGG